MEGHYGVKRTREEEEEEEEHGFRSSDEVGAASGERKLKLKLKPESGSPIVPSLLSCKLWGGMGERRTRLGMRWIRTRCLCLEGIRIREGGISVVVPGPREDQRRD